MTPLQTWIGLIGIFVLLLLIGRELYEYWDWKDKHDR